MRRPRRSPVGSGPDLGLFDDAALVERAADFSDPHEYRRRHWFDVVREPWQATDRDRQAWSPSAAEGVKRQLRTGTILKLATPSATDISCASNAGEVARLRSSPTTQNRQTGDLSENVILRLS